VSVSLCGSLCYQALLVLAVGTSAVTSALIIVTKRPVTFIQPYILEVIALALSLPLTYLNHYRTRTSATLILLFWPLYALVTLVWARTTWHSNFSAFRIVFYLKNATLFWALASLGLECLGSTFGPEDVPKNEHGDGHTESPLLTANIYSIWTFGWMSSLMQKGAKTYITEDDLPSLVPEDESTHLGNKLQDAMHKQYVSCANINACCQRVVYSKGLIKALCAAYGGPYAFAACLKIAQDSLSFLQPQLLRWLLQYISAYQTAHPDGVAVQGAPSPAQGFAIAALMFIAATAQTVLLHQVSRHSAGIHCDSRFCA
jgi:ATP-binding cassette, subfamily C (CFTR/MRP), member 1